MLYSGRFSPYEADSSQQTQLCIHTHFSHAHKKQFRIRIQNRFRRYDSGYVPTGDFALMVNEVCKAIVGCLLDKYISKPRREQAMEVIRGFEEVWGFPQCFGAPIFHFLYLMAVPLSTITEKDSIQFFYRL